MKFVRYLTSMLKPHHFFLLFVLFVQCKTKEYADLVILGGTIYTASRDLQVEAVVVKRDRIYWTGSAAEAQKFVDDKTKVIDLQGKTMTPGFIEGHGHLMGVGYNELELDLMNVESYEEMIRAVGEAVQKANPANGFLDGAGTRISGKPNLP